MADRVVAAVLAGPSGTIEIAGPEARPLSDLLAQVLAFDDDPRRVIADHAAGYFGSVIEDDSLVPAPDAGAWIATTDLAIWLESTPRSA